MAAFPLVGEGDCYEREVEVDNFPRTQKITTEVVAIQLTVSLVGAMRNPS